MQSDGGGQTPKYPQHNQNICNLNFFPPANKHTNKKKSQSKMGHDMQIYPGAHLQQDTQQL